MMPRVLLFDVFGTVVDWRGTVSREATAFLEQHGASRIDGAAFADAWRARYAPSMATVRRGERAFVRLDVLHRENLLATLPEFGLSAASIAAADIDAFNRVWHRLAPWPDAVAGLARLREAHIVAPLSNGNIALLIDLSRQAGLQWDAILGAEVVRAYKPAPEAYLRTVELLCLRPDEVCLVAAHNDDLAAARGCGLRTAFVSRPTEHGPGQTRDLVASGDWDWVAGDFLQLADRLANTMT
jgi:2-haloacid dehalogenase